MFFGGTDHFIAFVLSFAEGSICRLWEYQRNLCGERQLAGYTYAPRNGNLTQQTYGNGDYVTFQYDSLNRTTQKTTSGGNTYTYSYTRDGQLGRRTDAALGRTYGYTYDSLGRLVGYQENRTADSTRLLSARYTYDDSDRVTKFAYSFPGVIDNAAAQFYYNSSSDDEIPDGALTQMSLFSAEWLMYMQLFIFLDDREDVMPRYNKNNTKELKKFLYNSCVHDAELKISNMTLKRNCSEMRKGRNLYSGGCGQSLIRKYILMNGSSSKNCILISSAARILPYLCTPPDASCLPSVFLPPGSVSK